MKSEKIEENGMVNAGGSMADIAMAVASQQKKNYTVLNKDMLPSKGKYYQGDIQLKKLSTIDIKNLSTLTPDTIDGIINGIVSRCVLGINVNDILVGDKYWLIFYLRNLTYNDYPYSVKYKCESCGKSGLKKTTMKDSIVNYIKDDFSPEYTMDNR